MLRYKQVARLQYGDSLAAAERRPGPIAVYGSNGSVGEHDAANTLSPVIVIGRKGSYGKLNFVREPVFAIDTTYFVDSRSCRHDLRWLYYATHLLGLDEYSEDSAVPGLNRDFVYSRELPVPQFGEQRAIADFLDRETSKIDALVAKKERLIELLQEKRTALITHAVTKGLDPNVPMKPSGIDWLGDIPAHWEVVRLKHGTKLVIDCKNRTPEYTPDGEFGVVRTTNVRDASFVHEGLLFTSKTDFIEWTKRGRPIPGDVLLTREAPAGEACLVPERPALCLGQRMMLARCGSRLSNPRFLVYSVYGPQVQSYIEANSKGSTVPHLRVDEIRCLAFPAPPSAEQDRIATSLSASLAGIAELVRKIGDGIERLLEYRTALISAAVTGKIDVRGEVG